MESGCIILITDRWEPGPDGFNLKARELVTQTPRLVLVDGPIDHNDRLTSYQFSPEVKEKSPRYYFRAGAVIARVQ